MSEITARHVFVRGRVQGVGFRYHTQNAAEVRSVTGWVRNLYDGRVEVWAEGTPEQVESMVEWLRRGPSHARVDHVDVLSESPRGHATFRIDRSGSA